MSEVEENQKQKKEVEFSFLLLGLASLIPWNAILSELDFFLFYQKEYSPQIVFLNINFAVNLLMQFILLTTKKIFSYKTLFIFGLCGYMTALVSLPLAAIFFPGKMGFMICCLSIFINGFSNAVFQSSLFGLVSYFSIENVIAVGTGQGISGILMTLVRYGILLFLDEQKGLNLGAYLFFGISALIILYIIRQVTILYKNPVYLEVLNQIGEIKKDGDKLIGEKETELQVLNDEGNNNDEQGKSKKDEKGLLFLVIKILDINIMIILCFTITIGLFPGSSIKPSFFGLSIGWKINTLVFLFNLFDTIGRKLVGYIKKPQKWHLTTVTIIRFVFLASFPCVIYMEKYNKLSGNIIGVLSLLNTCLMALTSGVQNNLCFSLAPEGVEGELKAKAGSSVSLCLAVGLFAGSLLANFLDKFTDNL